MGCWSACSRAAGRSRQAPQPALQLRLRQLAGSAPAAASGRATAKRRRRRRGRLSGGRPQHQQAAGGRRRQLLVLSMQQHRCLAGPVVLQQAPPLLQTQRSRASSPGSCGRRWRMARLVHTHTRRHSCHLPAAAQQRLHLPWQRLTPGALAQWPPAPAWDLSCLSRCGTWRLQQQQQQAQVAG